VASHRLDALVLDRVPDLQLSRVRPHGKEAAISGPLHARYAVIGPDVAQLSDFAVHSRPKIDTGAEANGEDILCGPVDQVQIEIILEARGVQYFKWLLRDHPLFLILF